MKVPTQQINLLITQDIKAVTTYQSEFPSELPCSFCGSVYVPLLALEDAEGLLSKINHVNIPTWPHDCLSIVIYICKECGNITCLLNQA